MAIIRLGPELLPGSSDLPESDPRPLPGGVGRSEPLLLSYLVLLHVGFALPRPSPSGRCALTLSSRRSRTFSPLPRLATGRYIFCGTVRTCPTPRAEAKEARQILAVSQHTALRSPDFPPRPQGTRRSPSLLTHTQYGRFTWEVQRMAQCPRPFSKTAPKLTTCLASDRCRGAGHAHLHGSCLLPAGSGLPAEGSPILPLLAKSN